MALIEINREPSRKELNWFGVLFLAFFGLVGGIVRFKLGAPGVANGIWAAAGGISVLYYAVPPLRRPLYLGWIYAAFPIGWVVSHLVLAVVYYLVFTPIGLIMRLSGWDPLQRRFRKDAVTYWKEHDPHTDTDRYFRQF